MRGFSNFRTIALNSTADYTILDITGSGVLKLISDTSAASSIQVDGGTMYRLDANTSSTFLNIRFNSSCIIKSNFSSATGIAIYKLD